MDHDVTVAVLDIEIDRLYCNNNFPGRAGREMVILPSSQRNAFRQSKSMQ